MALETISQILSPTNATYVNGVSARRNFSAAVLENMYQGLVEKADRGVNDEFVSTKDAEESAQVFVNRILPTKMQPREMGASVNGGSFSANQHYTQTITVAIDILMVLDDPIIIPRARQDMIPVDLLAKQTKIYSDRLATILNGATASSKLMKSWLAEAEGKEINKKVISASDITNSTTADNKVLKKFIEANSMLDEGDMENGIDIFPLDTRIAVFKVSYRAVLKGSGVLNLGGANYGYEIAQHGGVDKEGRVRTVEDGFVGEIDGVPCHLISNESLQHASQFLGLPALELKNSPFSGYIASSYANARGISASEQTKVVDAISGQGLVLQPYTKFGVACWFEKGNVIITNAEYNPIKGLKDLFNDNTIVFKVKPAGSRLYPVINSTITLSSSAFTVNATALDDFNTDHVKGAWYVVGATPATTVAEFLALCEDGENATFTLGTSKSFTATLSNNDYVSFLVIADDGSVALANKKYIAG